MAKSLPVLPDPLLERIHQFANELIVELNKADFETDWNKYQGIDIILKSFREAVRCACSQQESERRLEQAQQRQKQRKAYIAQHGLMTREEAAQYLGLSLKEWEIAEHLRLIHPVDLPKELLHGFEIGNKYFFFYPSNLALTPQERILISENVFLTRKEAIARLGISPYKFDKLRETGQIEPIEGKYCLSDILALLPDDSPKITSSKF